MKEAANQQKVAKTHSERMDALLDKWEEQAERYDAILTKWEEQTGISSN